LVPDYASNIQSFLNKNPDSSLPSSFTAVPSSLQYVHTDDDALDLVIRFEGGWMDDPRDPGGATNHGITLSELSRYLGKTASMDDLRNLSVATARDIYRKTVSAWCCLWPNVVTGKGGLSEPRVQHGF
jgi:hypothetical protein